MKTLSTISTLPSKREAEGVIDFLFLKIRHSLPWHSCQIEAFRKVLVKYQWAVQLKFDDYRYMNAK